MSSSKPSVNRNWNVYTMVTLLAAGARGFIEFRRRYRTPASVREQIRQMVEAERRRLLAGNETTAYKSRHSIS